MKIVVIGGGGLIGTRVAKKLADLRHEALAASPNTGVDATTGRGLTESLAGAAVVVDVSNSPSFEDTAVLAFFESLGHPLHHRPINPVLRVPWRHRRLGATGFEAWLRRV